MSPSQQFQSTLGNRAFSAKQEDNPISSASAEGIYTENQLKVPEVSTLASATTGGCVGDRSRGTRGSQTAEGLASGSCSLEPRSRGSPEGHSSVTQREQAEDQEGVQGQTGPELAQGLCNKELFCFWLSIL